VKVRAGERREVAEGVEKRGAGRQKKEGWGRFVAS